MCLEILIPSPRISVSSPLRTYISLKPSDPVSNLDYDSSNLKKRGTELDFSLVSLEWKYTKVERYKPFFYCRVILLYHLSSC